MSEDYSKLEGKIVYFPETANGAANGRVVGCDPDIGITITDLLDDNRYLLCLLGPSAPQRKMESYENDAGELFSTIVNLIKSGTISYDEVCTISLFAGSHGGPSTEDCAFGQ